MEDMDELESNLFGKKYKNYNTVGSIDTKKQNIFKGFFIKDFSLLSTN
jgi:hypothetical protein